uniref:Sushi domain-containing protein n=1 Tax=Pipistrellus kuhlii TaxID=59472 RepID=A0A7J7RJZ1_PIPKU|nr:hypothetical protein mPipKuh1_010538 [Pipistrellus kuhlii]
MLLLVHVILTLWVSWARGQESACDPPRIANSHFHADKSKYGVGDTITYSCKHGFDPPTQGNTAKCTDMGWDPSPRCSQRECIVPDIEQELLAQPQKEKYVIGDVLKFYCRYRFKSLLGPDSIQCYHFGWSPNPPTCKEEVQSCDQPPRLPNGAVADTPKEQYEHGEVVEYACNPRFLMKGAKKIQCVDGKWTPLPMCVEEHSTCGDVPELKDGEVVSPAQPSYHHGDSVEFTCRDDFTMVGHSSVTCIKGMWTQPPQCIATGEIKTCKLSRAIASETKLSYRVNYGHNRKISYTCGRKSAQKHSVCMNGKWQPEVTCTEAPRCPPPPQIPNSQPMTLTVSYQEGEKISILCQENFLIQEGEEMVCQDGRWQSIPRCVEKTPCSPPPHIEHGSIKSSRSSEDGGETLEPIYEHGTTLSYICKDGFKLSQGDGITCHLGKWSASPQCVGLPYSSGKCGHPPAIDNGDIISNPLAVYAPGSSVEYQCQAYYMLEGNRRITCRNGEWSEPPKCLDIAKVFELWYLLRNSQLASWYCHLKSEPHVVTAHEADLTANSSA